MTLSKPWKMRWTMFLWAAVMDLQKRLLESLELTARFFKHADVFVMFKVWVEGSILCTKTPLAKDMHPHHLTQISLAELFYLRW
mmetsp:Transcript_4735/g.4501  ORF Transcript_4735/g.4501 Transcript_4735/m.4501 type:complete len:84 (+) Transcript_4735:140-391(+)